MVRKAVPGYGNGFSLDLPLLPLPNSADSQAGMLNHNHVTRPGNVFSEHQVQAITTCLASSSNTVCPAPAGPIPPTSARQPLPHSKIPRPKSPIKFTFELRVPKLKLPTTQSPLASTRTPVDPSCPIPAGQKRLSDGPLLSAPQKRQRIREGTEGESRRYRRLHDPERIPRKTVPETRRVVRKYGLCSLVVGQGGKD